MPKLVTKSLDTSVLLALVSSTCGLVNTCSRRYTLRLWSHNTLLLLNRLWFSPDHPLLLLLLSTLRLLSKFLLIISILNFNHNHFVSLRIVTFVVVASNLWPVIRGLSPGIPDIFLQVDLVCSILVVSERRSWARTRFVLGVVVLDCLVELHELICLVRRCKLQVTHALPHRFEVEAA